MQCPSCHRELIPGARFCGSCGASIAAREPEQTAGVCLRCGTPLQPGARFCNGCGAMLGDSTAPAPPAAPEAADPGSKKRRMKTGWKVALGAVAVIAVAALLVVLLGGLLRGPATDIGAALMKTLRRGSCSFELAVDGEPIQGRIALDPENRDLTLHMVRETSGEYHMIVYKGYAISGYVEPGRPASWHIEDIHGELEGFFDAWERLGKPESLELEALLEEAGLLEQAEKYMDVQQLEKCMKGFLGKLNDTGWLEENAGYRVRTGGGETAHSFELNVYTFLNATLPEFESAFRDPDTYDILQAALRQSRPYLKQLEFEFQVGIRGGMISSVRAEMLGKRFRLELSDLGKTRIDTEALEDILKEAGAN